MDLDDLTLIRFIKTGDLRGSRQLVDKYSKYLLNVAKHCYTQNEEDANELVEDTLIKAIQRIYSFKYKGEKSFRNWLYTILKNNIKDRLRKNKKSIDREISFNDNEPQDDNTDSVAEIISRYVNSKSIEDFFSYGIKEDNRKNVIYEVLKTFPPEHQADLISYFNEIPHDIIAKYRNSNEAASRKHINRLAHTFFERIGEIVKQDGKLIYERYKKENI